MSGAAGGGGGGFWGTIFAYARAFAVPLISIPVVRYVGQRYGIEYIANWETGLGVGLGLASQMVGPGALRACLYTGTGIAFGHYVGRYIGMPEVGGAVGGALSAWKLYAKDSKAKGEEAHHLGPEPLIAGALFWLALAGGYGEYKKGVSTTGHRPSSSGTYNRPTTNPNRGGSVTSPRGPSSPHRPSGSGSGGRRRRTEYYFVPDPTLTPRYAYTSSRPLESVVQTTAPNYTSQRA